MSPEDISDLKAIAHSAPERPAFYKDTFSLSANARVAARILRRHGFDVQMDGDTGRVVISRDRTRDRTPAEKSESDSAAE